MRLRSSLLVLAPVLLFTAGCGSKPLNVEKTLTLDTNTAAQSIKLPAQSKAVKITVEFSSSDKDVSVHVFKESDISNDEAMTSLQKDKALGSATRGKEGKFTADIPENTATRVVVREHAAAKTDVTIKVTAAP